MCPDTSPPSTIAPAEVARLRAFAKLLDEAIVIPGTNFGIGLDPLLGLIPGAGDVAGSLLSLVVLLRSAKLGVPQSVLVRMTTNIAVDALVGAVPVLGDLFDVGFKANTRNLRLLESHFAMPAKTRRASRLAVAAMVVAALLAIGAAAAGVVWIIRELLGTI
jgi:hypothetical protein